MLIHYGQIDLVGEVENTTTEANALKCVLRVRDAVQIRKLLSMKKLFDGTAVTVELRLIFNKRRCVISCYEIQNKPEQKLTEWMAKNGVVGVKRITRMQDGKQVNTQVILTLNGTAVPDHIKDGPLRIKTRIYIPDPMICYRCFDYGHSKIHWQNAENAPRSTISKKSATQFLSASTVQVPTALRTDPARCTQWKRKTLGCGSPKECSRERRRSKSNPVAVPTQPLVNFSRDFSTLVHLRYNRIN